MAKGKCCGNCEYHLYDEAYQDFYCSNEESDNCGEFTDYKHVCEEYEER